MFHEKMKYAKNMINFIRQIKIKNNGKIEGVGNQPSPQLGGGEVKLKIFYID